MESGAPTTSSGIELTVRKEGLSQRANGDWHLKLVIRPEAMDQRLALAAMGSKFDCMLVELPPDPPPPPKAPKPDERQAWRDMGAVEQAAIRCREPVFWAFLSEEMFANAIKVAGEETAARVVREHCGIESRSDLSLPGKDVEREKWRKLDSRFQAWLAREGT